MVRRVLRSLRQGLGAWRITHRPPQRPDAVVIGTLRRPRLAIAMRAAVVPTEPTPPPLAVFLERMLADPLSPYCPRCSLPLSYGTAMPGWQGSRDAVRRWGGQWYLLPT